MAGGMNPLVVMALRANGLDPRDPLVRLTLRVVKRTDADFETAYAQASDPTWAQAVAETIATDDQRAAVIEAGGFLKLARDLTTWAASDKSRLKKLFAMKHLL